MATGANDEIFPDNDYSQWAANVTATYEAPKGFEPQYGSATM